MPIVFHSSFFVGSDARTKPRAWDFVRGAARLAGSFESHPLRHIFFPLHVCNFTANEGRHLRARGRELSCKRTATLFCWCSDKPERDHSSTVYPAQVHRAGYRFLLLRGYNRRMASSASSARRMSTSTIPVFLFVAGSRNSPS